MNINMIEYDEFSLKIVIKVVSKQKTDSSAFPLCPSAVKINIVDFSAMNDSRFNVNTKIEHIVVLCVVVIDPGTIWGWESGSRGHQAGAGVGRRPAGETTLQPHFPHLDMLRAHK